MSAPRQQDGEGLRLAGASVSFEGAAALDDADLHLPRGEVLAVLGPSGSGKSTLLRAVAGLQPLTRGTISWDGRDLAAAPPHRRGFALMFQDGQLFAHRTVGGNVAYALPRGSRGRERGRRIDELLELVGLPEYADRRPATLSGGEQQRVALARALAAEPRLLLLDEPLSGLDAALRSRLAGDLRQILTAAGATAIAVTHDHAEAFALADRVALLDHGRLVQEGAPAEVWRHPASPAVAGFLGYVRVLEGEEAASLREAGGAAASPEPLAVRPGVLRVVAVEAGGARTGKVVEVRPGPDQILVEVEIDGWGRLPAHASPGLAPRIGDRVRVAVDLERTAAVGA